MTTNPAPLLTAELAVEARTCAEHQTQLLSGPAWAGLCAIATNRTRCVQVLTEAECRERFEAWAKENWNYTVNRDYALYGWLACAKAMGAVKEGT